jgi:hypothetical protein
MLHLTADIWRKYTIINLGENFRHKITMKITRDVKNNLDKEKERNQRINSNVPESEPPPHSDTPTRIKNCILNESYMTQETYSQADRLHVCTQLLLSGE